MKLLWALLFFVSLQAEEIFSPFNVTYTSIAHGEYEGSIAKDNNDTFPNDTNSFASWYNVLNLNYTISEDFYLSFGAKANVVVSNNPYSAPFYLRAKLSSNELNQAIVSDASVTYDNGLLSLSAGRNSVDYDWLIGSMDGVIGVLGDETLSMRLFWFENFTQLQYNYYFELTNINDSNGIYGGILQANKAGYEVTLYEYYMQDLRNLLGLHVNYTMDYYALNFSYSQSDPLALALYDYDESIAQLSFEALFNEHYLEMGVSLTGENGLLAMIQLGSFMTGQFYLSNQVDRENAKNIYTRYMYTSNQWSFEILGGYTEYDNTFLAIVDELYASEVDVYLGYEISKAFSLSLGVMGMQVDKADPISVSQYLTTLNIGYYYEYF